MAILKIQLLSDNGEVLKNYATKGNIGVYGDIVKQAICSTLGVDINSAIEMRGLPKEAEEHILKRIDRVSKEKPKEVVTLDTLPSSVPSLYKRIEKERPVEAKHSKATYIEEGKSGFVKFKCPHCGEYHVGVHQVGDTVKCHNCKEELTVPKDLVLAQYTCPNCNSRSYLFIEESISKPEVTCRICKSPIDLYYHDKKGKFLSAR